MTSSYHVAAIERHPASFRLFLRTHDRCLMRKQLSPHLSRWRPLDAVSKQCICSVIYAFNRVSKYANLLVVYQTTSVYIKPFRGVKLEIARNHLLKMSWWCDNIFLGCDNMGVVEMKKCYNITKHVITPFTFCDHSDAKPMLVAKVMATTQHWWIFVMFASLLWRHNEHDSVSNHQPRGCLLDRLFRRRSKKTSKLRVTGLCVGNSPGPVNSPHKGPVTRKMFPFDDVIMYFTRDTFNRSHITIS